MVQWTGTMEIMGVSTFWRDKRVFLTGHTGFKGSWMALWLTHLGAKVTGYALAPEGDVSLFEQLDIEKKIVHHVADINNFETLKSTLVNSKPDIVFHLAAQSLVLRGYQQPLDTWRTNTIGTANLLEALRQTGDPATTIIVTTDKVYHNFERDYAYRETDPLGGLDPYSASKAATELVVGSYRSVFDQEKLPVGLASARAGNVIGGGDWSDKRLVPDIARALMRNEVVRTRNPNAVRPWQHVLEPLNGYMLLAERLSFNPKFAQAYNFGPENSDNRTVLDVVQAALKTWKGTYEVASNSNGPYEAELLMLDIEKAKTQLGWSPKWTFETAIEKTMRWYRDAHSGRDAHELCLAQISEYMLL